MPKKEKFTFESLIHTVVHLIGVGLIFWFAIFPPLWVSILAMIVEIAHMKLLGHCISTNIAHKRNIMVGMTYWEYVSYLFGAKDHKRAGFIIDTIIKIAIVGILLFRTALFLSQINNIP